MSHDPDPEVLLRITICQRNKDHWLGSRIRIIHSKNPALTPVACHLGVISGENLIFVAGSLFQTYIYFINF
ncbi:hypothetical protein Hanom_Chr09g00772091 [Helianthus anomalus]